MLIVILDIAKIKDTICSNCIICMYYLILITDGGDEHGDYDSKLIKKMLHDANKVFVLRRCGCWGSI